MTKTPKSPNSNHSMLYRSRGLLVILSVGMLAGVLIWAKLRLVTDIPRSAYADPRESRSIEEQSGGEPIESEIDQEQSQTDSPTVEELDSVDAHSDQSSKP